MSSLDLDNSYSQASSKLSALKTFSESKSNIQKASQNLQNQLTSSFDTTKFQAQAAELEKKIKKQVQSQFEKLIGLILSQRGSGSDTFKFLLQKIIKSIKILKSKLGLILTKCFMKFLGCDINTTFQNISPIYIKVSSIDLFDILKVNPNDKIGKLLYENFAYSPASIPRSTNLGLNQVINTNNEYSYFGYSSNELFKIKYVQINPITQDATGWFQITLTSPINKVVKFFADYYKTISIFDIKNLIANLLEALFGIVSIKLGAGSLKIDDTTKFGLLIQRILGLCFDDEQEISVSGQAKTPELDDTTDSFYEMSGMDISIIEERTNQIQRQVITLETCDTVEFPVNADQIIDAVESIQFNEDGSNFASGLNQINVMLANDKRWSMQISYPQLSIALDFNILKKIPLAVVNTVITPKVLLPFYIMLKALQVNVDDSISSLSDFLKKFGALFTCFVSRIGAEFVRLIYEELKKDIQKLVLLIIRLIIKDETGTITAMIERLINITKTVLSIIQDYRKCKNIIDSILQLLNIMTRVPPQIPSPLMMMSNLLPGYSPNRAFINSIEEMQKMGLPTGDMPDGSPNLFMQSTFAMIKGMDTEQKINGKTPGVVSLPPPYGVVETKSKSI